MSSFLNLNKNIHVLAFFLIFFLIGIFIFSDYGISIDEDKTRLNGFISLEYIFKIFAPNQVAEINKMTAGAINTNYGMMVTDDVVTSGIVFDLPLALLELIFKVDDSRETFLLRHFSNFLIFFISVYFFFKLVKNRYDSWIVGIIGALFLIISPRIFADSFYNNKDVVFMSLFIINLFTATKFLEKKNFKWAILFALTSALTINVRIFGLILPILVFSIYFINILRKENNEKKIIKPLILFLILALFFTILFWPYLWENPIQNFLNALKALSEHNPHMYTFYLGEYFLRVHSPWHYHLVWIFLTTPFLYIILFFIGFMFITQRTIKRLLKIEKNDSYDDLWRGNKELQDLLFLLTFLIPIIVAINFGSISYDGWRHLYFIYPSFLLTSMLGLHLIKIIFFKKKNNYLHIFSIILIIPTAFWMYKNHPFQYAYFNFLAGKNFNEKFEMDYYGVSNKNALEYIIDREDKKVKIYNLNTTDLYLSKKILKKEIRETIDIVHNANNADYITNNYTDWRGETMPTKFVVPKNFKIMYEIKVDDVTINTIYKKY